MKNTKQHTHQIKYFSNEFRKIKKYKLSSWQKSYIKRIKKYLLGKDFKKKTIIDIGTGSAYVAIEMAKLNLNVVACDLTPTAIKNLEHYKKQYNLKNVKTIICGAENIPIKNKSVDFIVASAILEHIPDERKAILEWKRILKPSGKMFILVPLKYRYVWPFFLPIHYFHDKRIGHLRRYDESDLKNKFKLKITKTFYTGHLLKMLGIIFQRILNTHKLDNFLEKVDSRKENVKYGASNISVILQNNEK